MENNLIQITGLLTQISGTLDSIWWFLVVFMIALLIKMFTDLCD